MAHTAPIILALIVNCCEIFIFRNAHNVSYAPHTALLARDIFTLGNYFLLLSTKLYPKSFRRTHWIPRSFVEFILGIYLFETFLCDFWFPLENFLHCHFQNLLYIIKKKTPKSGPACIILCNIVALLINNKKVLMAISVGLSTFITLIIIHGTRTIDFGIIRRCGMKEFVLHFKDQILKGVKRLVFSLTRSQCCDSGRSRSRSCSGPSAR